MHDGGFLFDANVLSNFARIGRLDLLPEVVSKIFITHEVLEELRKGCEKTPILQDVFEYRNSGFVEIVVSNNLETLLFMAELRSEGRLGIGEISLLGIAKELDYIFVSDDKLAKKQALHLGIKVLDEDNHLDTVVILKQLLENGVLEDADYEQIRVELGQNRFVF